MPDEMSIEGIDAVTTPADGITFTPLGTAITAEEIKSRLSANLYSQLCDGDDANTLKAVQQAEIYAGAVFRRLKVGYSLDIHVQREYVLSMTIYNLHMALGHEEAGKEYRIAAKDMILAAYGDYPDSTDKTPGNPAGASVSLPLLPGTAPGDSRYRRALTIGDRLDKCR
jgi:hypothetical protein